MKPQTVEQVFELLDAAVTSAALGAALEHRLFWMLADRPREAPDVAGELAIPMSRCRNWLRLLCTLGFLEENEGSYQTSERGKSLILDAYTAETWAFLADAARRQCPAVIDLALHIKEAASTWDIQGVTPPNYLLKLQRDPEYARRFTRMLYEIHRPLADELAAIMTVQDATALLDLGGGSGVMSLALLDRFPGLRATVVDLDNVCPAGQEIARERGLSDRITYRVLDYVQEDLPKGFDRILCCDTGPYTVDLFEKVRAALTPGGRLILVDQFSPAPGIAAVPRLTWAFLGSLENPDSKGFSTAASVISHLEEAGFHEVSLFDVPAKRDVRWETGWQAIEAQVG